MNLLTINNGFHKAFESRTRLSIMSVLVVNDALDFNALKQYLDVTDGKLASQVKVLEKEEFIGVKKTFIGKKPNTKYFITKKGKKAFDDHLKALEQLINSRK
jgi:DNA-binding HxlR family transcriptional regulator